MELSMVSPYLGVPLIGKLGGDQPGKDDPFAMPAHLPVIALPLAHQILGPAKQFAGGFCNSVKCLACRLDCTLAARSGRQGVSVL